MTGSEMAYEVTEKGEDGQYHTRRIIKKGPTGLITTSTKTLGEQAGTRTLTISIPDSVEQTRAIMHVHAVRADQGLPGVDHTAWLALQRWLELACERRVVIPFEHSLAELVTARPVRMRRDFNQLLTVIQTIAMLLQHIRERDSQGRIIATIDDYKAARWLLDEVFTTTVNEGATPAIRETVEAVARLSWNGEPVMQRQLVDALNLSKSVVHYRVMRAVKGGWLANQTTIKGAPAQFVLGELLPDENPLPPPEDVLVCVEHPDIDSNLRTMPGTEAWKMGSIMGSSISATNDEFEAGMKKGEYEGGFKGFEPIGGDTAHTVTLEVLPEGQLPWDAFLEGREDDEPHYS